MDLIRPNNLKFLAYSKYARLIALAVATITQKRQSRPRCRSSLQVLAHWVSSAGAAKNGNLPRSPRPQPAMQKAAAYGGLFVCASVRTQVSVDVRDWPKADMELTPWNSRHGTHANECPLSRVKRT